MGLDLQTWKTLSRLVRAIFTEDGGTSRVVEDFIVFRTFLQDNDLAPGWLLDLSEDVVRDKDFIPVRIVWDQVGDQLAYCELQCRPGRFGHVNHSLVMELVGSGGLIKSVELWPNARSAFSGMNASGTIPSPLS